MQGNKKYYNRITLRPKDPIHVKPIWEFTCEEILYTMPYFTLLSVAFLTAHLVLFFLGQIQWE